MGQRKVPEAKYLGKLKSEHRYSNGTDMEVIGEILSLISLRGSDYQGFQIMSLLHHVYQHQQNASDIKFSRRQCLFLDQRMAFTYSIVFCIVLLLRTGETEAISLRRIQSAFSPSQETTSSLSIAPCRSYLYRKALQLNWSKTLEHES